MTCGTETCANEATRHVFWPGRLPLAMCAPCAVRAVQVGAVLGCYIHTAELDPDGLDDQEVGLD